jgi:tetratricopeptide (TPR) repeat protein
MDQLSAHLDRGWDLAQRGDAQGAASSAERALELAPDSPEAHNLLGFAAAMQGDSDDAIEAYQQAMLLDETYVEAMLNAAEMLVHPLGEFDEALSLCDQILELSEYPDERLDASLLKFEALMAKGDDATARRVLQGLPEGPYDNPVHNYLTGRAYFELGQLDKAHALLGRAVETDPTNADAQYYLGLLCEARGDRRGACEALLRSRQLELELGTPGWSPNAETFLLFTENAIRDLDEELRELVARAELYVADLPGPEMIVDGVDPRAMALVDALLTEEDAGDGETSGPEGGPPPLVRVFLYAINILKTSGGLHGVQQQIHDALNTELRAAMAEWEPAAVDDAPAGTHAGNGAANRVATK